MMGHSFDAVEDIGTIVADPLGHLLDAQGTGKEDAGQGLGQEFLAWFVQNTA
ncbi:MAG: hypothetical protein JXB29_03260 [Sedimentisphaerales bacterium]|nr:hypothetical protein [Sedimentisphaerales bacterium]